MQETTEPLTHLRERESLVGEERLACRQQPSYRPSASNTSLHSTSLLTMLTSPLCTTWQSCPSSSRIVTARPASYLPAQPDSVATSTRRPLSGPPPLLILVLCAPCDAATRRTCDGCARLRAAWGYGGADVRKRGVVLPVRRVWCVVCGSLSVAHHRSSDTRLSQALYPQQQIPCPPPLPHT